MYTFGLAKKEDPWEEWALTYICVNVHTCMCIRTYVHECIHFGLAKKEEESARPLHTYVFTYIHVCILTRREKQNPWEEWVAHLHTYVYNITHLCLCIFYFAKQTESLGRMGSALTYVCI